MNDIPVPVMNGSTATFEAELKNWLDYDKQLRRPRGHSPCLCGSGLPFRKCHRAAFQGVVRLAAELDRLGVRRRSLFQKVRAKQEMES